MGDRRASRIMDCRRAGVTDWISRSARMPGNRPRSASSPRGISPPDWADSAATMAGGPSRNLTTTRGVYSPARAGAVGFWDAATGASRRELGDGTARALRKASIRPLRLISQPVFAN